jgi:hypothetical protein
MRARALKRSEPIIKARLPRNSLDASFLLSQNYETYIISSQTTIRTMEQPIEAMTSGAPSTGNNEEDEEDSTFLGRTGAEWGNFFLCLADIISMLVIGCLYWDDCAVIPSLNVYVVTFAAVDLTLALSNLSFVLRYFRSKVVQCGRGYTWSRTY